MDICPLPVAGHSPQPARFLAQVALKSADHRSRGSLVVVAFGDSVTMGATAQGVLEPEAVYHRRVQRLLETKHPQAVFSFINAGVGGDTMARGRERLERDVLRYHPDLVLVGFGLNDAFAGDAGIPAFEAALGSMAGEIVRRAEAEVVLLTPSFMAARESDAVPEQHRDMLPECIAIQAGGVLGRYAEAVRRVAARARYPLADVYAAWERLARGGVDTTALLANGLNHPNAAAHAIAARCVMDAIEPDRAAE